MRHIKVTIHANQAGIRDILIAVLAEGGYEGFEEEQDCLFAYIPETLFDEKWLSETTDGLGVKYTTEAIEPQNWNAIWESGFEPVVVDGFCTIRAHFHDTEVTTPYVVVITPKMSFGTGHHATTQLMMMGLKDMDIAGRSVLDFGTGTGVLAILASMLGATDVLGIDNDEWAVTNAIENLDRNEVTGIEIEQASLNDIPGRKYDIILANINRHILLEHMTDLYRRLETGGQLLMSGLLDEDVAIMQEAITSAGFVTRSINHRNGWISILVTNA